MSRLVFAATLLTLAIYPTDDSLLARTIDDFSAGPFAIEVLRYETESTTLNSLPADRILGGSRFVTLNGLGPSAISSVRVGVDTAQQVFRYDADPGASAANFWVTYGKEANLHANLLADGANALVFDFQFANFEPGSGALDVTIGLAVAPNYERGYLFMPVPNSLVPFSLVLPFNAFGWNGHNPNYIDVNQISFGTSNGILRGDFALTGVRTAFFPEGDYNYDGSVNSLDYLVWKSNFGDPGPYPRGYPIHPADGNRNGLVDAADYLIWRDNLGASASAASVLAVPEPNCCLIALLAVIGSMVSTRTRMRDCARFHSLS